MKARRFNSHSARQPGKVKRPANRQHHDSLLPSQETYPRVLRSTFCDDRKCALEPPASGRLSTQHFVAVDGPRCPRRHRPWLVPFVLLRRTPARPSPRLVSRSAPLVVTPPRDVAHQSTAPLSVPADRRGGGRSSARLLRRPRSPSGPAGVARSGRCGSRRARHDADMAGRVQRRLLAATEVLSITSRLEVYRRRRADRCSRRPLTRVTVPATGTAPALVVLAAGGFAEEVVVTGRRVETRLAETPQKVEVIDATDIERTVAADLTDVLKKNAGVDVIQYSGRALGHRHPWIPSAVLRHQQALAAADRRPAVRRHQSRPRSCLDGVERIEVLKGAASSVYGSSAMGGVVNVITRQSRGKIGGTARLGRGQLRRIGVRRARRRQRFVARRLRCRRQRLRSARRLSDGQRRGPAGDELQDLRRLGAGSASTWDDWRLDGARRRISRPRHHDTRRPRNRHQHPGPQGSRTLDAGRASHGPTRQARAVRSPGTAPTTPATPPTSRRPIRSICPFLPYLSFESDLELGRPAGSRMRGTGRAPAASSSAFDYERVTSVSRSYSRTGERTAPFSADSNKRTAGVYAENTLKLRGGRTVVALGGRVRPHHDRDGRHALQDEFRAVRERRSASSTPASASSTSSSKDLRGALHFRACIHSRRGPDAHRLHHHHRRRTHADHPGQSGPEAGAQHLVRRRRRVDFAPATRLDVTVFRTVVKDRFISNVVISNPPPPDPIVAVGCQRPGRAHQRPRARGRAPPRVAHRPCLRTRRTTSTARNV